MMKKNFNIIASLFAAALIFGCVLPAAATTEGAVKKEKVKTAVNQGICANTANLSDKFGQKMVETEARLEKKKAERDNLLSERQLNRDKKLAENRSTWNEKRDIQYLKLEKRASTTVEKEAVAAFKTAMTAAISARRTAVDKAIADFRAGLKEKITARQKALDAAVAAYKSAKEAAFAKAKADCAAKVDPKIVRETLKNSLKAAQDKFKADRQAIEKIGPNVKALTAAKKAALEKAVSDFKVAAEKARAALKAAFGKTK